MGKPMIKNLSVNKIMLPENNILTRVKRYLRIGTKKTPTSGPNPRHTFHIGLDSFEKMPNDHIAPNIALEKPGKGPLGKEI